MMKHDDVPLFVFVEIIYIILLITILLSVFPSQAFKNQTDLK
jgi:hypothetical protein